MENRQGRTGKPKQDGNAKAKAAATKDRDDSQTDEIPAALQSLEVYESKRDLIIAFARAIGAEQLWGRIRTAIVLGGLLAAVGAVGFGRSQYSLPSSWRMREK